MTEPLPIKISQLNELTTPTLEDAIPIESGGETYRVKPSALLVLLPAASTAETNTGAEDGKYVTPKGLKESIYGRKPVQVNLNASVALVVGDKAYIDILEELDGWRLAAIVAKVGDKDGNGKSSSGAVTITAKNGVTSMLSTNLTIDQGEASSATAATPVVIDEAHDTVAAGDSIEIACSGAGTGVTYCRVTPVFQKQ